MKRGAVTKQESQLVALWVPKQLLDAMDLAIRSEDSDRSKFIRRALRRHIMNSGTPIASER
jgi:metal-responsive CopG/Arc/MetJ family transcriptional regulator